MNHVKISADDIAREMAHEQECLDLGRAAYVERTTRYEQKGMASENDYGRHLLVRAIQPFANAIDAFLTESESAPGRKALAATYLKAVPADVAAFIAARVILDGIASELPMQRVAVVIGGRIEDELRFADYEEKNPRLFWRVKDNLDKHPQGYQRRVKRSMLVHSAIKFGVEWKAWSEVDKLLVGTKLLDLFIESTGLVQIVQQQVFGRAGTRKVGTKLYVVPTDELKAWIAEYKNRSELMCPFELPTIIPPRDWSAPTGGGYYHPRLAQPLVKVRRKGTLAELRAAEMPVVYDAINALQRTAWRINGPMLDAFKAVWEAGVEVKGVPHKYDIPCPPRVEYTPERKAEWIAWKEAAAASFRQNKAAESRRHQIHKIVMVAEMMAKYPAIYFPMQLDFRGRMYCSPQYLHPQGSDLAKSLLTFSNGKRLGHEGWWWLSVHIANCFGEDKCGLEARSEWTLDHSDEIVACASDPVGNQWWTTADKPFQFLAACIEWAGYVREGEDYVSTLPVMVDGSCNGIQHFSAMLRDPISGKHVNLLPADKPGDIYAEVATQVMAALRADASEIGLKYGKAWAAWGLTRKSVKRCVMVLPYGGTRDSARSYLAEHVEERAAAGDPAPFSGRELGKAVAYLSKVVWKVMRNVVVGPMVAMDYLRTVARIVSAEGLPVAWTAPSGFPVVQMYMDIEARRVKTKVGDSIIKLTLQEETDTLDKRRQAQAIAPNFVHSIDAAALAFTLVKCVSLGLSSFAAVHDSYGTLAADMPTLAKALREAFVELYSSTDVLARFAEEVSGQPTLKDAEFPPLPAKGDLDIRQVLESDFFFA